MDDATDLEKNISVVNKFTCGICYEEYDPNCPDFEVKMLTDCKHTFCKECFTSYYESLI